MNLITFDHVTKTYGEKLVFDQLTLDFPENGIVSIIGPSGLGKTTLFRLLLGLETPDSGRVGCSGSVSVVFQEDRLLPWASVLDNVLFSCLHAADHEEKRQKAISLLEELGLGNELSSYPAELSGGMARRVSVARSLLVDADIYLMDEPTKGLDAKTRRLVWDVITEHTKSRLLLLITHQLEETDGACVIDLERMLS